MAAAVAQEVLSSIRTVVAFGGEDREVERSVRHLNVDTCTCTVYVLLYSVSTP